MDALIGQLQQTQTAVAVAGLVLLLLIEHIHPFFDFFQGSIKKKGMHLLANMALGITNAVVTSIFLRRRGCGPPRGLMSIISGS